MCDAKWWVMLVVAALSGCVPALVQQPRAANTTVPEQFVGTADAGAGPSSAEVPWREFFADPKLVALIDAALANNQELHIVSLELDVAQNEVMARQGEFLPKLNARVGVGLEKVGQTTSQGVSDEAHGVPAHLPDFGFGLAASWEVDVWGKLRGATKAAATRYLASVEGRKFAVTVLVGEVASTYYELLALDAQWQVLRQNLTLQQEALELMRLQKQSARVTELAVKRFEADVLKNESRLFVVQRHIVEAENHLNFLVGRFPQHVDRADGSFTSLVPAAVQAGLPSALLANRPDVKRAELELAAAELDVQVARASFFPSIGLSAAVGARSFDVLRLITTPASLFYNAATDLMAPLLNRQALTANYFTANAKQQQAVFHYERAILKGCAEVGTQLATIDNLTQSNALRAQAVDKLNQSIEISTELFASARADYVEILMVRREALESQLELIETKKEQLNAVVALYQALGGGWR